MDRLWRLVASLRHLPPQGWGGFEPMTETQGWLVIMWLALIFVAILAAP
jgi:hypothetical protein